MGWFSEKLPFLVYTCYVLPARTIRQIINPPLEKKAWKGQLHSNSRKKSILFFTINKAGSTFLQKQLHTLARDSGMRCIDYERYFMGNPNKKYAAFKDRKGIKRAFKNTGMFYGALRHFIDIPCIEKYKIILVVRDPRDILVSQYHSITTNHPVVNMRFARHRKAARKRTIDEQAIFIAPRFNKILTDYVNHLVPLSNVLIIKYEDLINGFEDVFIKLAVYTGLNTNIKLINDIIQNADFSPADSDKYSHKQSVVAGKYKDTFKNETIEKLDKVFHEVLKTFNYL